MVSAAGGVRCRPHDLLWPAEEAAVVFDGPRPGWATTAWLIVAPMVVRRAAPAAAGVVRVGLRGAARSERCAGHLRIDQVGHVLTPEAIARRAASSAAPDASALPCLQALARLAGVLDASPLAWGVTGGVGFMLASGLDVLRPDSDLDLLVRAPRATDADALRAIARLLKDRAARVDVQVETPLGAFALAEWSRTGGAVLLKTAAGPCLVADPWQGAPSPPPAGTGTCPP
jgi:phosphoribosyl-dephospho-CoA transferase